MEKLRAASEMSSLSELLGVKNKALSYLLYKFPGGRRALYRTYPIKKKSGGERIIHAPIDSLLEIQRRLSDLLGYIYEPRSSVHGFVKGRSIKTNAEMHAGKRLILNIDLKDFFHSINFGRVRGMFLAKPYLFNPKIATLIAQIVCIDNILPQGGATSPIVSNMICQKLDNELRGLAKSVKIFYTRYADDISFSTNLKVFPSKVLCIDNNELLLNDTLLGIVKSNGFDVNEAKVRLQSRLVRQEVTGLVVNEFVNVKRSYIRQVRSMLHAWDKFGVESAQKEYYAKYYTGNKRSKDENFVDIVHGKVEFIKHIRSENARKEIILSRKGEVKEDVSDRLFLYFSELMFRDSPKPLVRTEGKTDILHLKAALSWFRGNGLFRELDISFWRINDDSFFGEANLKKFCETQTCYAAHKSHYKKPIICLFDRDLEYIVKKHTGKYLEWGNNIFSLLVPKVEGLEDREISIEALYDRDFLTKTNRHGRRIFFAHEFDSGGVHKTDRHIRILLPGNKQKNIKKHLEKNKVIDANVFDTSLVPPKSIALSKNDFSVSVIKKEPPFDSPNFERFKSVFDVIGEIVSVKK